MTEIKEDCSICKHRNADFAPGSFKCAFYQMGVVPGDWCQGYKRKDLSEAEMNTYRARYLGSPERRLFDAVQTDTALDADACSVVLDKLEEDGFMAALEYLMTYPEFCLKAAKRFV